MFFCRKGSSTHWDSRRSASRTIFGDKTQWNENAQNVKQVKSEWKKSQISIRLTQNPRLEVARDGFEEEETIYIRSSMEEEEDEVFLKRVLGSRIYPPAPPDK